MKTKFKSKEEQYAYAIAITCNAWNEPFEMPSGKKYIFPKPRYNKMSQEQLEAIISGYNMGTEEVSKKVEELVHETSLS